MSQGGEDAEGSVGLRVSGEDLHRGLEDHPMGVHQRGADGHGLQEVRQGNISLWRKFSHTLAWIKSKLGQGRIIISIFAAELNIFDIFYLDIVEREVYNSQYIGWKFKHSCVECDMTELETFSYRFVYGQEREHQNLKYSNRNQAVK